MGVSSAKKPGELEHLAGVIRKGDPGRLSLADVHWKHTSESLVHGNVPDDWQGLFCDSLPSLLCLAGIKNETQDCSQSDWLLWYPASLSQVCLQLQPAHYRDVQKPSFCPWEVVLYSNQLHLPTQSERL
jgi:hypothetical protein